ncbi:MAG: hypothetical protein HAW67_01305 [Endozoicomonadaceae bacterium]|nr:hypothetical protein [Endozoicomonadaceae bacterium]
MKLVKNGWLKKVISKKKGMTNYVKTELFDLKSTVVSVSTSNSVNCIVPNKTPSVGSVEGLNCRLQDYKNDLLEGLGEAEEYRTLRNEFPEMHDELQPKYNNIRESNSRLLGKIRAIETLIENRE